MAFNAIGKLNELQKREGRDEFTPQSIQSCDVEILIENMKELDHKDELDFKVPIKDELQSYNILKNDKYKRFKSLKEVLDEKKRHALLQIEAAAVKNTAVVASEMI